MATIDGVGITPAILLIEVSPLKILLFILFLYVEFFIIGLRNNIAFGFMLVSLPIYIITNSIGLSLTMVLHNSLMRK